MKYFLGLLSFGIVIGVLIYSFSFVKGPAKNKAQKIIDNAIVAHGGKIVDHSRISFDFRNRHYVATRDGGQYTYERIFRDSSGRNVSDILTNDSFSRMVDGEEADIDEKKKADYTNSVNSVIYFALLPYFLNDQAVVKTYLGETIIKNRPYHKIKVTFRQEGGGEDFEDEYIYWIHQQNNTMDYLAYSYQVDGGGARFRSAYNIRKIKGIRFADYINYKPLEEDNRAVETFGQLHQKGALKELSRIELENVEVELLE